MVTIHGISHSLDHTANRIGRFRRGPEAGIHIALFHGSVKTSDATPGDHHAVQDLQAAGMDYWALGHDHRYRQVSAGRPWIVYPGTLQGRTLKGDDTGPKGAVVATVSEAMVTSAVHHELDAVRLLRTQVDASTLAGPADFRRALSASAPPFREQGAGRTVIASCDVFGRRQGWMGTQLADGVWDRVLDEVRQEQAAGDGHIWWDSVVDLTDTRESQPQNDASMYVHQLVEVFRRAPAGLDRLLTDLSVAPGSPSAGHSSLDSVEMNALLTKAERVALSLLEPNEP
jgi:DNA repair exonuclease SbcCD nuclease subunit